METTASAAARADPPPVSNPLGWDGDAEIPPPVFQETKVSNPLGWDGDSLYRPASNQLLQCF